MPRIANVNVIPQMPSRENYSYRNLGAYKNLQTSNIKHTNNNNLNSNYKDSFAIR